MRTIYLYTFLFIQWLLSVKCFLMEDTLLGSEILQKDMQNEIDNYLQNVKNILGLHDNKEINRRKRHSCSTKLNAQGIDLFYGFSQKYQIPGRFMNDIVLFCFPDRSSACFAATLEAKEQNSTFSNKMVLYKFQENEFIKVDEVIVHSGNTLTTHFIHSYQYVIVAQYFDFNYRDINTLVNASHVFIVDRTTLKFQHVQLLDDRYLSNVFLWEHENLDAVFLTASVNSTKDLKYNTESHIYKLLGKNFDKIDTIQTYSPKCITPFIVGSTMYIAVANFQNDEGETDIDSEIFRFNLDKEKFMLHQRIKTHAAMDIKHFSFDVKPRGESFLVVANHFVKEPDGRINYDTYSVIYKFSEDEYFIPFQSFRIEGAIQWLPIVKSTDQFLLLVASKFHGVKPYQYDGWRFVEIPIRYTRETFGPGIASMRQFHFNNASVITIANKNNDGSQYNIFSIDYKRDDTLPKYYSETKSWCTKTLEDVKDNYSKLTELMDFVKNVPHVDDQMIRISSGLVLANDNSKIDDLSTLIPADDLNRSGVEDITEITKFINSTRSELDELKKELQITPSVLFQETQHFSNLEFNCYPFPCDFNEVNIETLNGEDLTALLNNSLNLRDDLKYSSDRIPLEFEHVAVQNPLDANYINGHKVDDLITKQSMRDLNQKLIVRGNVFIDNDDGIIVKGVIDKTKISNDSILEIDGDQNLSDKALVLDTLHASNLTVQDGFNGMQLNDGSIKKGNSRQYVKELNVDNLKLKDGRISGVDIADIAYNTLKINATQQEVKGYYMFDLLVANEVSVRGKLYQIGPQRYDNPLEYYNNSFIKSIALNEYLNAYTVNTDSNLYEKYGNIERNSATGRNSDGSNSTFKENSRLKPGSIHNKDNNNESIVYKKDVIYDGDVKVNGRLIIKNGELKVSDLFILNECINLTDLINNALRLNDTNINQQFIFKTPFKTESLKANEINGIKPESWVKNGDNRTITGRKLFNGSITFDGGVIIDGKINGIDLKELERKNYKRTSEIDGVEPENINDYTSAKTPLTEEKIEVNDDEEIIVNGTVIVKGNVYLDSLQIDDESYINEVNAKVFVELFANNNVSTNFDKPKIFNGNLTIDDLTCDDFKEFDIRNIQGSHWCETYELQPNSKLEYLHKENISVDSLTFTGTLDGVTADEFGKWLLTEGDQVIIGEQTVSSVETMKGINIASGLINNVNLTELLENGVRIDKAANLSGLIFNGTVEVDENVKVDGLINGIDIPNDIVLSSSDSPIYITGEKILMNNLSAGSIYNDRINELCQFFSKSSDEKSLYVNGSVEFSEEPSIEWLNRINVDLLYQFAWLRYNDKVINATVVFPDVVFGKPVDLKGTLNNRDIEQVNKQYFSLSSHQTIGSPIIFNNGIVFEGQLHAKKVNVGRYVNGVLIEKFADNVLLKDGDQVITGVPDFVNITILGDLETTGLINGLNLENDVLMIDPNGENSDHTVTVHGHTLIKNVKTGELIVEPKSQAKIQNVDIDNWFNTAVKSNGLYVINGRKTFKNGISLSRNIKVDGLVNGIKFDKENILLPYHEQVFTGKNVFDEKSDVIFNELYTKNKINNVNISDLIERLVLKNENNEIVGDKNFWSELYGDEIILPEYYGERNLTKINDDLLNYDKNKAYLFDKEFKLLYSIKKKIELSLSGRAFILIGWKKIQQFKENNINLVIPLSSHEHNNNMIAAISSTLHKSHLTVYEWNENQQSFIRSGWKKIQQFKENNINLVIPLSSHEHNNNMIAAISSTLHKSHLTVYEWNENQQSFIRSGWKKIQQFKENNINLVIPLSSHEHNNNMIAAISSTLHKSHLTVYEWNENQQSFIRSGAGLNFKFTPYTISAIPSYETNSGLQPNKMFVVTRDIMTRKDNVTHNRKKVDNLDLHSYKGWLLSWNSSVHQVPKFDWVIPMHHPGLLLHVHSSCYILYDHKQGLYCQLYCQNTLKNKQLFNCTNAIQGTVVSDGNNSYIIMLRKNIVQSYRNHTVDINKQYVMDIWKFDNGNMEFVNNRTTTRRPYSMSAVYDSYSKHYIISVTSEMKITVYRFSNKWDNIENLSAVIEDKTSAITRILPTKEIVLFVASSCTNPSTQIWVGGLSNPKKIPIDVNGSEIKQVIPIKIPHEQDTSNHKNNYDSFIIVTDTETAVFQPIYSL